ncbi:MAG TPA: mechanosensitive ion channel, partial [Phaeodactylibacter sp.]|nr:mechanosensitive ion channel [Phaeodactylibacter sp.]
IFTRILTAVHFDKLATQVKADDLLKKANISLTPSQLIGKFFYWLAILLVVITLSDTMGWESISKEISNLLRFLPKLLMAIVFFIVGTYIATFIRDIIRGATSSIGISTGKMISSVVFYFLLVMVTLTALNQAGMDTSIITSNLLLILGAVLAAAAISYGVASRDVLSNILASFFSRKTFGIGQVIEVEGARGEIVSMNNISVTIKDQNGNNIVIPTQKLINNNVVIFKSGKPPHAGK